MARHKPQKEPQVAPNHSSVSEGGWRKVQCFYFEGCREKASLRAFSNSCEARKVDVSEAGGAGTLHRDRGS